MRSGAVLFAFGAGGRPGPYRRSWFEPLSVSQRESAEAGVWQSAGGGR